MESWLNKEKFLLVSETKFVRIEFMIKEKFLFRNQKKFAKNIRKMKHFRFLEL